VLACLAVALAPARAQTSGKKHALLVGVREYDSSLLETLKCTENDVEELGKLLSGKGGFTAVRLLTSTRGQANRDDAPTAANIRAALAALLAKKTRDDTVLVALSGHGVQVKSADGTKEREQGFFCPADAQVKDQKSLLSLAKLFKDLEDCSAGVKLVLVDACRNDPALGRSIDLDSLPRPARGIAALFSCKSGERAFESKKLGKGHGVFFHFVLEGLRGEAKNRRGEVTWSGLADYVTEKVADEVPVLIGDGAKQTPQEIRNLTGKPPVLVQAPRIAPEAERLFRLAMAQYYGQGRKIDYVEAARCFGRAAELGHPLAEGYLGFCHAKGTGVKQDEEKGQEHCRRAADRIREAARGGDPIAQSLLGSLHREGLGVKKDDKVAVAWYRRAAEGYAVAQYNLGWMHDKGWGVDRDEKEAVRWYRKAAEQGLALAENNLGASYANGEGVDRDDREAVRWYRRAASQNYALAQRNLGWMYDNGRGVGKDEKAAVRWYRKAADQGDAAAQNNLGVSYDKGQGVEMDEREAVKWYRKAADQGYALAQCNLGISYANGQGVAKDAREAVKWYRKAAEQGHAQAQHNLGVMYDNGRGVGLDEQEAVKWYRRAAVQGYAKAQYNLGVSYDKGQGVEKDEREAVKWYRKAAVQGDADAQNNLGWMYEHGRGVSRNLNEARKWYRKAAAQGHVKARKNLADLE
jgi:TPR repeat protein